MAPKGGRGRGRGRPKGSSKKYKRTTLTLEKKIEIAEKVRAGENPRVLGRIYGVNESTIRAIRLYGESIKNSFTSGHTNDVFKLRRTSLSIEKKMEIINKLEAGERVTALGREYGVNESTIRTIRKNEETIKAAYAATGGQILNSPVSSRLQVVKTMEEELYDWIIASIQANLSVKGTEIKKKAVEIYQSVCKEKEGLEGTFRATNGWLYHFKKRFGLHVAAITQIQKDSHEWALLEAGNVTNPLELSHELDDGGSHLGGGQQIIKLPIKQEPSTSTDGYYPGSSSDGGPSFEPPAQLDDDSHSTFVDYVFQTTAQKEGRQVKSNSSKLDTSELIITRTDKEPKPSTSGQGAISIVCAPDLSAVKSPQPIETTTRDPHPPPRPIAPKVQSPPKMAPPMRIQSASKSVSITYKPREPSASAGPTPRVSVVYFGEEPEQHSTVNIEKVLMRLRAEKLLLEMDKLKAEREKMGVEMRNIMLRRKILSLRKELFCPGICKDEEVCSNDLDDDDVDDDNDDGTSQRIPCKEQSKISESTASAGKPDSCKSQEREEPAKHADTINIPSLQDDIPPTDCDANTDLQTHDSQNTSEINISSPAENIQQLRTDHSLPDPVTEVRNSSPPKPTQKRKVQDKTSSFHELSSGSKEKVNVKVEVEDPKKLEKVGIFYEGSGDGLDIERRLDSPADGEGCTAVEVNSCAETSGGSEIISTNVGGVGVGQNWDPSVISDSGSIGPVSSGYQNVGYKRIVEFEDSSALLRNIASDNDEDPVAKRRRIEDEFGLIPF